jgi:hypothetical protein
MIGRAGGVRDAFVRAERSGAAAATWLADSVRRRSTPGAAMETVWTTSYTPAEGVRGLLIGNREQDVRVAWPVERAVARKIATSKLSFRILERYPEPPREQILTVAAQRFFPTEFKRMRIPPFGRPSDNDNRRGEMGALLTRSLEPAGHTTIEPRGRAPLRSRGIPDR